MGSLSKTSTKINTMHTLTLDESIKLEHGRTLEAGREWYVTNGMIGAIMDDYRRVKCKDGKERALVSLAHAKPVKEVPFNPKKNWNGKTIHMFRGGGWGDIMFLSPLIRELKRRWPKVHIRVCCATEYAPALLGIDVEFSPMPVAVDEVKPGDAAIFYEGTIENNPDADSVHAVDLFAAKLGIELTDRTYPKSLRKRVGIQVMASSPVRTYHSRMLTRVAELLIEQGNEVYLFGRKGSVQANVPGAVNLAEADLDMRKSVAVMSTCDVMLTPDSSLFHVAQALNIPSVALFGSFDAKLRITNPENTVIIQANGACAPCFFHSHQDVQFPEDRPCSIAGFCTVLAGIAPERVVKAVNHWLNQGLPADGGNGDAKPANVSGDGLDLDGLKVNSRRGSRARSKRHPLPAGAKRRR
jgi:hypothetical protein